MAVPVPPSPEWAEMIEGRLAAVEDKLGRTLPALVSLMSGLSKNVAVLQMESTWDKTTFLIDANNMSYVDPAAKDTAGNEAVGIQAGIFELLQTAKKRIRELPDLEAFKASAIVEEFQNQAMDLAVKFRERYRR